MTAIPSTTWRMLAQRNSGTQLPKGLDAAWDQAVGITKRFVPRQRRFLAQAQRVLRWDTHFADMSDARLRDAARDMQEVFRRNRQSPEQLYQAFAVVREVAWRQRGEKPYPVQVAGALALYHGCVAEMATGEGKTLTATMPATVAAWRGRGCHIITVNDYLAARDAEWMGDIYRFCGLTVAAVTQDMPPPQRQAGYHADITYTTNKEVTADFLRDQLTLGRLRGVSALLLRQIVDGTGGCDRLVQRGLHYAIVDEADSVLIDESVTPLIISGQAPNPEQVDAFQQAAELAASFTPNEHFRINQQYREVELTAAGRCHAAQAATSLGGFWQGARRREELIVQALTARHFYLRDKQYVVQEGKVVIVDEFTGRLMPDREWRDGLHQAVAAKEQVEIESPKETYARISFQRFFRLYKTLSGMTGTAAEATSEFWQIYHLPVVVIPTNRPCIRTVASDRIFTNEQAKWQAVVAEIERIHARGRPILVGTRSVAASEHLSGMLIARNLDHQTLNAVRHAEEAKIVAQAGVQGNITVATNMAGRGTDIKLGRGIADLGGLHVIATERHESGRVDRQLIGRAARQGDPGSAQMFVSLEDELIQRHSPHVGSILRRQYGTRPREIHNTFVRNAFNTAQSHAERTALRQRKSVLRTDDWLDEHLGFAGREI